MKSIVIRSGVYGFRTETGRVRPIPKGERVSVPDEEAARLVALGVATFVDGPHAPPVPPLGPAPSEVSDIHDEEPPAEDGEIASTENDMDSEEACADEDGAVSDEEEVASDEEEIARLERMTRAELEQMAQDLGLDATGAKNKHELAVLIAAADFVPDPDDAGIVS